MLSLIVFLHVSVFCVFMCVLCLLFLSFVCLFHIRLDGSHFLEINGGGSTSMTITENSRMSKTNSVVVLGQNS